MTIRHDPRWLGRSHLPTTIITFILSLIAVVVVSIELSKNQFYSDPWFFFSAAIAGITILHSFIDFILYFCGALTPLYVIIMGSIQLVVWFSAVIWGCVIVPVIENYGYNYALIRAMLALAIMILLCYISSIVLSAKAHKRLEKARKAKCREILDAIQAFNAARAAGCTCGHITHSCPATTTSEAKKLLVTMQHCQQSQDSLALSQPIPDSPLRQDKAMEAMELRQKDLEAA